MAKATTRAIVWQDDPRRILRAGPGFDLASADLSATPGWPGVKAEAAEHMARRGALLGELQERLYAHGRTGGTRRILVVAQGIDTAGKSGVSRHVLSYADPQGVQLRSFGVPTPQEREHHYLWRIEQALPRPGYIAVFDRSHYEDVLVARVDSLVPEEVWQARYEEINAWEAQLAASGTTVVKLALMIDRDEQGVRLMDRIDRPDKRWKYSPGDVGTRLKWDAYQEAYQAVFQKTSTSLAPWYVIPANRRWYARLAIIEILTRTLLDLHLDWPRAAFDVEAERGRLAATMSEDSLRASAEQSRQRVISALKARRRLSRAVSGPGPGRLPFEENARVLADRTEAASLRTLEQAVNAKLALLTERSRARKKASRARGKSAPGGAG